MGCFVVGRGVPSGSGGGMRMRPSAREVGSGGFDEEEKIAPAVARALWSGCGLMAMGPLEPGAPPPAFNTAFI
jgi:hypothetical protein